MSENTETSMSGGLTVSGLLGVAFVILKLCGVIDWSWWWVLLPFWGPLALFLIILVMAVLGAVIYEKYRG